jgi:hypothetical protein
VGRHCLLFSSFAAFARGKLSHKVLAVANCFWQGGLAMRSLQHMVNGHVG